MAETTLTAEIAAFLDRLSALMRARDPAIIELFGDDDSTLLVGSEPGEIAHGRPAITALFAAIFASPSAVHWEWDIIEAARQGDIGWFFAEGSAVLVGPEETVWRAYRLSGVLVQHHGDWRLAQFHGSEPMIG
jgi:ketosteroid isomerase-like protein